MKKKQLSYLIILTLFFTHCNNENEITKKEDASPNAALSIGLNKHNTSTIGLYDQDSNTSSTEYSIHYWPKKPHTKKIGKLAPYKVELITTYLIVNSKNEVVESKNFITVHDFNLWRSPGPSQHLPYDGKLNDVLDNQPTEIKSLLEKHAKTGYKLHVVVAIDKVYPTSKIDYNVLAAPGEDEGTAQGGSVFYEAPKPL